MANDTATQLRRLAGFLMDTVHRADQQASNLVRLAGELDDMVPLAGVEEAVLHELSPYRFGTEYHVPLYEAKAMTNRVVVRLREGGAKG